MKARMAVLTLVVSSWTWAAMAQGRPPRDSPPGGHMPPPQAYEDCRGKKDYSISTSLTGDSGEAFLATLTDAQRKLITDLVNLQRQDLNEIVKTRRAIATELRRFRSGESADRDKVLSLSKRYGELDGEMSYLYATAFAEVGKTLSAQQKEKLARLRTSNPSDPKGPFLYSSPINMPKIENTDFLFGSKKGEKP